MYVYMYIHIYIGEMSSWRATTLLMYTYLYMNMYIYVYSYVYICIYIHIQRRDVKLARAALGLLGNLLACHNCRDKLVRVHEDLTRECVAARLAFPNDAPLGRVIKIPKTLIPKP